MEILNRIIGEFKEAFQYFKERNKNKYYGNRFEEWVVKNSNISRKGSVHAKNFEKPFWKFLEWRGDKYIEGYRPVSSSSPDLLLECINCDSKIYKTGDIIAVECKWRSKQSFYLDKECANRYEEYVRNDSKLPIKNLFYVFGFGWYNGNPQQVYIIPAKELYTYSKEKSYPVFYEESTPQRNKRLEKYRHQHKFLTYLSER